MRFVVRNCCRRQAGHRLCSYIDRVIVLVNKFSEKDDDDLRESCNQVYEAFVKQCPEATKPHIQTVRFRCLLSSLNFYWIFNIL